MSGAGTGRPEDGTGRDDADDRVDAKRTLPVAEDGGEAGGRSGSGGAGGNGPGAGGDGDGEPAAPGSSVSSWRLVATLAVAGVIAGLVLVAVHGWAQPRIEAHRAEALRQAIHEVLGGPDAYRTLWVADGALASPPPAGLDTARADRVYLGVDAGGAPLGFAVAGEAPGYQDVVRLIFGFDPETGRVMGMKVLESKETPGLGDKIVKDSGFIAGFSGVLAPIEGVKSGAGTGDEHEVDMISGATISSETVIEIINRRLADLRPLLEAYRPGTDPAGGDDGAAGREEAAASKGGRAAAPDPGGAVAEAVREGEG